jgi:glutamyl-tRNA synthetase
MGNLRTALLAWLVARSNGARFVIRMEDLDPVVSRRAVADNQLRDLEAIGIDWDGVVVFQSNRHELYAAALARLSEQDLVYECYCTRKEIQAASQAPNGPHVEGRYPGTCRSLSSTERSRRRTARPPALRLRAQTDEGRVEDLLAGSHTFPIDDLVLRRNDGTWAYNLAVVVDDAAQQIGTVVRADDLLSSTPRQQHLASLLGLPSVRYLHVPLVLNERGERLAKRDGAVTLTDRLNAGESCGSVTTQLVRSLGLGTRSLRKPVDLMQIRTTAWVFRPSDPLSVERPSV